MHPNIARALKFLRFTDQNGDLSLTNVALIAALVKMLASPQLAAMDLVPFLVSIGGYQFKRWMAPEAAAPESEVAALKAAVEQLSSKVTAVQIGKMSGK